MRANEDFCPIAFTAEVFPIARRRIAKLRLEPFEADDLLQDVCATVLSAARRRGAEVFAGRSQLSTWVYDVVANAWRMRLRSTRRRRACEMLALNDVDGLDVLEVEDPKPLPDAEIARAQAVARVERATVTSLSREQRAILARSIQGEKVVDIASRFGVSVGTMKSKMTRLRQKLSAKIAREEVVA